MPAPATAERSCEYVSKIRSIAPARAPRRGAPGADETLAELLHTARTGDDRAWERLHERFAPMLRGIARSYRLSASDVDDVVQTTWLQLFNHIDRLRQPAAVAGWLATTARRECLRLLQAPLRERLSDDPDLGEGSDLADPETELMSSELRVALGRALASLPERHRRLMTMLVAQPAMPYQELSTALSMPVGSIGPIRARSLVRLRRDPQLRCFCPGD
jgi:RNA polymerase sigma factor (sigma-70 family)